jgi:Tol biopolymer transport system component
VPGFDDRLRRDLERLAAPPEGDPFDRVAQRRRKLPRTRRLQAAGLALAVLTASAGGSYGLYRAFGLDREPPRPPAVTSATERNGPIAFVVDPGEDSEIVVIDPDDATPRTLVGPEPLGGSVAWSPDGSRLAFDVLTEGLRGAIDVIEADGTGRRRIAELESITRGIAWSPQGDRLAVAPGRMGGLGLIDVATGARVELGEPPEACWDADPGWHPDGRRLAFVRTCQEHLPGAIDPDHHPSILTLDLDTGAPPGVLVDDGPYVGFLAGPSWSPDGTQIAFSHGGDITTIDVSSGARRALTSKSSDGLANHPVWSPDGMLLAYTHHGEGVMEVFTMRADGSRKGRITDASGRQVGKPSWAPATDREPPGDAAAIAYTESDHPEASTSRIVVAAADGTGRRVLVDDPEQRASGPAWSPDGARIAFALGDASTSDIWTVDVDSGALTRLTDDDPDDLQPSWSPDGTRIAFVSQREHFTAIYTMAADGSDVRRLTGPEWSAFDPEWSPDGGRIAFAFDPVDDVEASRVAVMEADGSNPRTLVSTLGGSGPAWSPDGGRIAFAGADVTSDLWVVDADGGAPQRLLATAERELAPAWSPDGAEILYMRSDGPNRYDLYSVRGPEEVRAVTATPDRLEFAPAWNPAAFVGSAPPAGGCESAHPVAGDFDGDDRADSAVVEGSDGTTCGQDPEWPYRLRVTLANGDEVVRALQNVSGVVQRAYAAPDFDADGRDELLVRVDGGASTDLLGAFFLEHGRIIRSRVYPADVASRFAWGGSVTHQDALGCEERDGRWTVVRYEARLRIPGYDRWDIVETEMTFDGRDFQEGEAVEYSVPADDERALQLGGSGNLLDLCRPPNGG